MIIGGILLAVIANMILGSLYYSPIAFFKPWVAITKTGPDKMKKDQMIHLMLGSAFLSFITAIVLSILIPQFDVRSISQAALLGFLVWLGFSMPTTFLNNMYQMKPLKLSWIDTGYQLIGNIVMSSIIFLFI